MSNKASERVMNNRTASMKAMARLACVLVLGVFVSACSSNEQSVLTQSADGSQVMQFSPPEFLNTRAVVLANVFPAVEINGTTLNLSPSADRTLWRGEVQVAEGDDVELRVDWIENVGGRELLLAVAENSYPAISRNTEVTLREDDYVDDDFVAFELLDADNDRVPNLAERLENSDPFSSIDPGISRADAFIEAINPSDAPSIDGGFDLIWGQAQYRDREEDLLSIDNRLIGFDPARDEGSTEFRWGGMHDGQFLYLYILGESAGTDEAVDNRTPFADSDDPWQDDSVEIYWDGNRSQGSSYDGVDDFHLIIPLSKLNQGGANRSHFPDGSRDPDGRVETGFNSAPIDFDTSAVHFGTCLCPRVDTFEIRLDMEMLQIPVDQSFGFDIQINNDADGGDRNFKFAWRAPSAAAGLSDGDVTWENPSTMGLLELFSN